MKRIVRSSLVVAAMVTGLCSAITSPGKAEVRTNPSVSVPIQDDRVVAQLFYPPVSDDPTFRVIGRGRASQPADRAKLQFQFTPNYYLESPPEGTVVSRFHEGESALTEETLQPIVDALVRSGVPADTIEVRMIKANFSFFGGSQGGAEVVVKIETPTRDRLEEIVDTATEAADNIEEILLNTVAVEYAVDNCQVLEQSAYQSAVQDAQNRASSIAQATGAELRQVPSIAEPFYGVFLPGCNSKANLPFGTTAASPYDPNAPIEVEVTKDIFVTYTVK